MTTTILCLVEVWSWNSNAILLCRGLFVFSCCSGREVVVHHLIIGGIVDHHYLNFIFMIKKIPSSIYHLKIVNITYF
jgi:hypothetical protein